MVDTAGEVPASRNNVTAINNACHTHRPYRAGAPHAWRLTKETLSHFRVQPCAESADKAGKHSAPSDGPVDLREFLNGA